LLVGLGGVAVILAVVAAVVLGDRSNDRTDSERAGDAADEQVELGEGSTAERSAGGGSDASSGGSDPDGTGSDQGDGGADPAGRDSAQSDAPTAGDSGDATSEDPAAEDPTGTPGGAPAVRVPEQIDPVCQVTSDQLLAALSGPEVARVVGGESFETVRCAPGWASIESSTGTIAVMQNIESGWTLVALGDDQPCLELEIPADVAAALACSSTG
jgi:hypothetical protein